MNYAENLDGNGLLRFRIIDSDDDITNELNVDSFDYNISDIDPLDNSKQGVTVNVGLAFILVQPYGSSAPLMRALTYKNLLSLKYATKDLKRLIFKKTVLINSLFF